MIRYQTKEDRRREYFEGLQGDTNISIVLLTTTESSEENFAKYQIRHCRYFPKSLTDNAHWGPIFYIDGKLDGFPEGFQSLEDVSRFLNEEVERLQERVTEAIISNDNSSPTLKMNGEKSSQFRFSRERWETILTAWKLFQEKFEKAKAEGKVITYEKAKLMQSGLEN